MSIWQVARDKRKRQQKPDLDKHMKAVGQNGGQRDDLTRHGNPLDQRGVIDKRCRPRNPGKGKKVVWNNTAQGEYREVRNVRVRKDFCENESQNPHQDQRIQERPEYAERHVPVPNLEILLYQIRYEELIVTLPHMKIGRAAPTRGRR